MAPVFHKVPAADLLAADLVIPSPFHTIPPMAHPLTFPQASTASDQPSPEEAPTSELREVVATHSAWWGLPLLWSVTVLCAIVAYLLLVVFREYRQPLTNGNSTEGPLDESRGALGSNADFRGTDRTFRWNNSFLNLSADYLGNTRIVFVSNLSDNSTRRQWTIDVGGIPERTALLTKQRPQVLALVRTPSGLTSLIGVGDFEGDQPVVSPLLPFEEMKTIGAIVDFEITPDEENIIVLLEAGNAPGVASLFGFALNELRAQSAFHCPAKHLSPKTFALDRPIDLEVVEENGILSIGFGPGREDAVVEVDMNSTASVDLREIANSCGSELKAETYRRY